MTTIALTNYNALVDDDGSNTTGSIATKEAVLRDAILTPVQAAITSLDGAIATTAAAIATNGGLISTEAAARIAADAAEVTARNAAIAAVTDATLPTTDITTNNVAITKHGFAPKAPNDATKFLNGVGAWAVPASGGAAGSVYGLAHNSAVQSLANATYVALILNVDDFQVGTLHSTSTNNTRVTVATTGAYLFVGSVLFAANATGLRTLALRINGGTTYLALLYFPTNGAANPLGVQVVGFGSLTAGDYIELLAYQDSGGALNSGDAATRPNQNSLYWFRVA
jgi:hypothetical protein